MNNFDVVILSIVATGALMVIGGLCLIGTGALKLAGDKAGNSDFKIGTFLHIGTTVPGLGIFIVGLAFDCTGLYYANLKRHDDIEYQARRDDIKDQLDKGVQEERQSHELHLVGTIQMADDQDVRLSVCMGDQYIVGSNNWFDKTIGPYPNYLVITLETAGAPPQRYTVSMSDQSPSGTADLPPHLIRPQHGRADMTGVRLNQLVRQEELQPQVSAQSEAAPRHAVGSAYEANR
jgi:hypothetical protein